MNCKNCGIKISGHPNKKFCSNKGINNCKDAYHNRTNPRGRGRLMSDEEIHDYASAENEMGWDGHKIY